MQSTRSAARSTLRGVRRGNRVRDSYLRVAAIAVATALLALPKPSLSQSLGEDVEPFESALEETEDYDPLAGMDPDGRIPRPEMPADLPNPQRWRYVPEGRIKPGNIFQRLLVSSFVVPLIFVESDVGAGGGIAVTDIDFRQQRRREFAGIFLTYTTKGQQAYQFAWRRWTHHREHPDGGILQEERSFLQAGGGYSKSLTRRFFGLGPNSEESDETSFSDESSSFYLGLHRALPGPGDDWILRLGVRGEHHHLSQGKASGEPSTEDVFPQLFDAAQDARLGWLDLGLAWDTRDSQRNPYQGTRIAAIAEGAVLQRNGETGGRFTLEASHIFPLPGLLHNGGDSGEENPPTDSLALGFLSQVVAGDLPFFELPSLGGDKLLRGYISGRWRDRSSWTAATEYRFWFLPRGFSITDSIRVERLGLALFYEVGAVAPSWPRIFRSRIRQSYGVSFRVSLERAAPFRVDLGFSDEGMQVNAAFGLPF